MSLAPPVPSSPSFPVNKNPQPPLPAAHIGPSLLTGESPSPLPAASPASSTRSPDTQCIPLNVTHNPLSPIQPARARANHLLPKPATSTPPHSSNCSLPSLLLQVPGNPVPLSLLMTTFPQFPDASHGFSRFARTLLTTTWPCPPPCSFPPGPPAQPATPLARAPGTPAPGRRTW